MWSNKHVILKAVDNHIKRERPFDLRLGKCVIDNINYPYHKKKWEGLIVFRCSIKEPKFKDDLDYVYLNAKVIVLNLDPVQIELSNIVTQLFRNDEEINEGEMKDINIEMKP